MTTNLNCPARVQLVVSLAAVLLSPSSFAQTQIKGAARPEARKSSHDGADYIQATIPFQFVVGNRTFPAGTYTFQRVLGRPMSVANISMLIVRGADPSTYQAVVTGIAQGGGPQANTRVMFKPVGSSFYLSEVWIAGESLGNQLSEHAPASELQASAPTEPITLLAELR
jgi:hypothetical protein